MQKIVSLSISDVLNAGPVDQALKVNGGGFSFTVAGVPNAPAYRDPSHLAAWLVGYWTAQDHFEKEN